MLSFSLQFLILAETVNVFSIFCGRCLRLKKSAEFVEKIPTAYVIRRVVFSTDSRKI